jgi:hypothetical protein
LAVIHLGIDLGSTSLRAAYSAHGDGAKLVTLAGAEWPWLLCEPATGGAVPVSFPSLKSRLGTAADADGVIPANVVVKALDVVRADILREPGTSIGHTVISVPARFFTSQRTALLAAAADAGLGDVSLITDSIATVIHQTAGARTGTYLVYGMGYGGYELGLIRAVRGTYRVLGYEGSFAPGGATFDAGILGSWLTALGRHGVVPSERYDGGADWLWLRRLAEQVKLRLAAGESVLFPHAVPAPGGELHVQFDQSSFNRQIQAMVTGTLDRTTTLLERTELGVEAVDLVTMVGGSTGIPALREVVGGLGRPVAITEDDHVARGALRHAHELGQRPTSTYDEPLPATEPQKSEPAPVVSPLAATVLTAPGHATKVEPTRRSVLDDVRGLISAGQLDAARRELRELIIEAQGVLDELDTATREQSASAAELIAAARKRFDDGDHRNAIAIAHLAWQKDLHDVDVFEAMLDLHCAAAMANPTKASFDADERWLRCALQHDPTNARIRGLLAERNYLQGKDLLRAGDRDQARRVLQATLTWAPDHPEATAMLREHANRRPP